jgi:hypothetical protein
MRFAQFDRAMAKKRARKRPPSDTRKHRPATKQRPSEEKLQGPPPREAMLMRDERESLAEAQEADARLTGGDVDADVQRAALVGEEAPGGSVSTPDQDRVDEIGAALGVPEAPDEEFRPSSEILDERDKRRWELER